jgi:hypothetical protein
MQLLLYLERITRVPIKDQPNAIFPTLFTTSTPQNTIPYPFNIYQNLGILTSYYSS